MQEAVRKFLAEMCRKAADEGADAVHLDHCVDELLAIVIGFSELFIFQYGYSLSCDDGEKHLNVTRVSRPGAIDRFWDEFGAMIRCTNFDDFFDTAFSTVLMISGSVVEPPKP